MKQLDAKLALVHEIYSLLAVPWGHCQSNGATHRWKVLAGMLTVCLTLLTSRSLHYTDWYISGILWCCSREVVLQCLTKHCGRFAIHQRFVLVMCAHCQPKCESGIALNIPELQAPVRSRHASSRKVGFRDFLYSVHLIFQKLCC